MGNSNSQIILEKSDQQPLDFIDNDDVEIPNNSSVSDESALIIQHNDTVSSFIVHRKFSQRVESNNYQVWPPRTKAVAVLDVLVVVVSQSLHIVPIMHFITSRFSRITLISQAMFTSAVFLTMIEYLGPGMSITLLSVNHSTWNNAGPWLALSSRIRISNGESC